MHDLAGSFYVRFRATNPPSLLRPCFGRLELPVPATQLARKDIKLSPEAAQRSEVQDSDVSPCLMKLLQQQQQQKKR